MDDETVKRWRALSEITYVTRHGAVDGIGFDLRHPDLDPNEWGTHLIGDPLSSKARSPLSPFIWFPWYGAFDKEAIKGELIEDIRRNDVSYFRYLEESGEKLTRADIRRRETPMEIRVGRLFKNFSPEAFVNPGDKIIITNVFKIPLGDEFEHPHDAEQRYAILRILRKNGTSQILKTPLRFFGHTSILARGSGSNNFKKMGTRILRQFGLTSVDDPRVREEIFRDPNGPMSYAEGALMKLCLLWESEGAVLSSPCTDIRRLLAIELALLMGYYWGKAEANSNMKPLAIAAKQSRKGASKAGRASGVRRRAKAGVTWQPHALELAKRARGKTPSLSQDAVAEEISALWQLESACPGHSTLKKFISELEKTGTLKKAASERRSLG